MKKELVVHLMTDGGIPPPTKERPCDSHFVAHHVCLWHHCYSRPLGVARDSVFFGTLYRVVYVVRLFFIIFLNCCAS
ncbi:GPI-anchored surface protein, putative [Bodo saltans]|uniref:GPI-anchored surface protein, putative n=1 Tax=Bodo saltans TaxID=75058 RepID=A0A0S4JN90_BODSA|nr:GPI-anchored surface protein, putative [Bodo saltans]|eukprot:CUG92962.1 GPI-anchored surface protein, putative [Bodo saltans]